MDIVLDISSSVLYIGRYSNRIEEERKLEEIRQEHIETTMRQYAEYARKSYEEDMRLYQDSIDSISAVEELKQQPSDDFR